MKDKAWFRNPYVWLLAVGVMARLVGAWLFTCNYSSDHAVPCLMSKHIVEGNPIPAFYYGQPYMGSLEPLVGALLYKLPFPVHFNCNLSTAFFGILLLPLIAWWGHRVGGRRTGVIALASAVIGPAVYVQFMNWPYGGYAATTFLVTACILCGLGIIRREREQIGSASVGWWIACGALNGLSWWTNPLSMLAMMTLIILALFYLRFRCLQWKIIPAAMTFLLFSFPFWVWNYRHHNAAIDFLLQDAGMALMNGLRRFLYGLAKALIDVDSNGAAVGLLLAFILAGVISFIFWRRNRKSDSCMYLMAAWVLFFAALFFFIRKPLRIGPARYFLPVMPALAVLCGHSMAFLNARFRFKPGWILLVLLLFSQLRFVRICLEWYANRCSYHAEMESIRPSFEHLDGDVIFTDYVGERKYGHGLNLYFNEAWCFTELPSFERCPYYVLKGEQAESVAVLRNKNKLSHTAASSGYTCRGTILPNGLLLQDHFTPPLMAREQIVGGITISDVAQQRDVTDILSDGNSRTWWQNSRNCTNQPLRITFDKTLDVEKIRIVAEEACWPESLRVEAQYAGSDVWQPAGSMHAFTPWYWPDYAERPYSLGDYYREEVRTALTNVTALQLTFNELNPMEYYEISEIQLMTGRISADEAGLKDAEMTPALIAWLASHQANRIYCDRWTATLLYNRLGDDHKDLRLSMEPEFWSADPRDLPSAITLDKPWTMVLRPENAALGRSACRKLNLKFSEEHFGRWVILSVQPSTEWGSGLPILAWKGFAPQIMIPEETAQALCEQARGMADQGDIPAADALLQRLLAVRPDYLPALKLQASWGGVDAAAETAEKLKQCVRELDQPQLVADARFENGIVLRGITVIASDPKPGGTLKLRYYWSIPAKCNVRGSAVFCHVKNEAGGRVAMDDHVLFDDRLNVRQTGEETFTEDRTIQWPHNMAPGAYELYTGLFKSNPPHDRLSVRTKLPRKNNSIQLPIPLSIAQ